ncbi:demethylmenaquinone methyltransferase/2-methoxy-6-polyprenyl-1,4-benzoquinol methylase [Kineococcus xinjiangensis]|uniref:Demethylmenaquinone methyltransferase/2-methoxy-6-polyprenyl-1,4-benzoquinol methylase n=1 Tax=Kineococcus xinjiangensis TaxID=512762 RepID=A0A2S6IV39_9ACTN|nr:methyltransferase domain-containing protein [Kineococcus xinjiangensis]PPK98145.1 demethylmenaquinone methyltransferase/2-methoxy-6-polyprenyl-1,4-benzoquinol methylase [Kineococcus xinjiangensis]
MQRPTPYTWSAPLYDVLSLEWPVYRAGRVAGVEGLRLRPGDRVLDVGCGTGLNFPLLQRRIGEGGRIVGVDASAAMLGQAARRARRRGWGNVELVEADATAVDPAELRARLGADADGEAGADAVLFTYALSLMDEWPRAWEAALRSARAGARVAVVGMAVPTGAARLLSPLARAACALGGADIDAHPWTALEAELDDVTATSARGGHLQVRAGTVPSGWRAGRS